MPNISPRSIPESLKLSVWSKSLINRYCLNGDPRSCDNCDNLISLFDFASTGIRRGKLRAPATGRADTYWMRVRARGLLQMGKPFGMSEIRRTGHLACPTKTAGAARTAGCAVRPECVG